MLCGDLGRGMRCDLDRSPPLRLSAGNCYQMLSLYLLFCSSYPHRFSSSLVRCVDIATGDAS